MKIVTGKHEVTAGRLKRTCGFCGRGGFVIRWTSANDSTWLCVRHSIQLLVRGI